MHVYFILLLLVYFHYMHCVSWFKIRALDHYFFYFIYLLFFHKLVWNISQQFTMKCSFYAIYLEKSLPGSNLTGTIIVFWVNFVKLIFVMPGNHLINMKFHLLLASNLSSNNQNYGTFNYGVMTKIILIDFVSKWIFLQSGW